MADLLLCITVCRESKNFEFSLGQTVRQPPGRGALTLGIQLDQQPGAPGHPTEKEAEVHESGIPGRRYE